MGRTEADSDRLHAILDESPIGVSVSRRSDGIVVFANQMFVNMLGVRMDAFVGTPARNYYVDETQRLSIVSHLKRFGRVDHAEAQFRRLDGSPFWALLTVRKAVLDDEEVNLAWIYDITDRKAAERELLLAAKVFETANEGILITSAEGTIEAVNLAFSHITGYAAEEAIGRRPSLLASGRHSLEFFESMWNAINLTGRWQGEIWNRRKNGEVFVEWLSIAAVRDAQGSISQYLGVFSDITARKEDEEQVWHQANYDALTGLPNRSLFLDRLSKAVRQAKRDETALALLFIDLDGFKGVNDMLGHAAGDLMLQETARRLSANVRDSDTVARLSGDEFTILLEHVASRDDVSFVAAKIIEHIRKPFDLNDSRAFVQASVGIALFPDDGDDVDSLMNNADAAMYSVKRGGKNDFTFFRH